MRYLELSKLLFSCVSVHMLLIGELFQPESSYKLWDLFGLIFFFFKEDPPSS